MLNMDKIIKNILNMDMTINHLPMWRPKKVHCKCSEEEKVFQGVILLTIFILEGGQISHSGSGQPDQTRPDQTRPDQTRPDQTRPDQTCQWYK